MNNILLDTHIFIWLMSGSDRLTQKAKKSIETCTENEGCIFVSAISIWEIGMLAQKGRLTLKEPILQWIQESLSAPYIQLATLSPEIAVESCQLPGEFHGDPADRMIVATSRVLNTPLLTMDDRILIYANNGHLECVAS
ncbi:MAG: type II toxin-antitoxin system VapC family toxin [Proteobacteria bacterium]|nr:type II toxin-antitoxin system VapC family toxin [Pseudomonadota bacterium]